jgi:hypothetical protein
MRSIQINLYKFDELSEEAKEVAREWWRDCEAQDPAWLQEHSKSAREAIKFIESYRYAHGVDELEAAAVKMRGECPWTGYCADATAIDAILESCGGAGDISAIQKHVRQVMEEAWEMEVEASMAEENVDECIRANDYEFTANGNIH